MRICPGCRRRYFKTGGRVRFPSDEAEEGYYEVPICGPCAELLDRVDKSEQSEEVVYRGRDEE